MSQSPNGISVKTLTAYGNNLTALRIILKPSQPASNGTMRKHTEFLKRLLNGIDPAKRALVAKSLIIFLLDFLAPSAAVYHATSDLQAPAKRLSFRSVRPRQQRPQRLDPQPQRST